MVGAVSRPSFDSWALALAFLVAQRSTCLRRAVGCVLVNAKGHVLATGYNGVVRGAHHCNEESVVSGIYPFACPGAHAASGTALEACDAVHAEANALLQCRDVDQIEACYATVSPCVHCVKLLLNTSCRRVVFKEPYPHEHAGELWCQANREWIKL